MIDSPAKESYFWNDSSKTVAEPALKSFFFNTGLYSDLLLVGNLLICVLISAEIFSLVTGLIVGNLNIFF